jgi:hypothetical protein
MVTLSHHTKATKKLIDIRMQWKEADKMLGPVIEMIPQLLIIPVLLFVVGLVDNIFSDILQLVVLSTPVVVTTSISLFIIMGVVSFLGYTLFDGSARPRSSPFQSTLAGFISGRLIPMVRPWISWLCAQVPRLATLCLSLHTSHTDPTSGELHQGSNTEHKLVVKHYHETVQAIHDDDTLDKASAALFSVLDPLRRPFLGLLREEEVTTLVHLLSPEASIRANRTAAAAISRIDVDRCHPTPQRVIIALVHAARRSVGSASITTLESSTFLAAMVECVIKHDDPGFEHPKPIRILGSKYVSLEHEDDSKSEVISLVCDIISSYPFWESPGIDRQPHRKPAAELFRPETISTSIVLQALCSLSPDDTKSRAPITLILIEAKTARTVIRAAFEVLMLLQNNSVQGLALVGGLARAAHSRGNFSDHRLLGDLCVNWILNNMQDSNFILHWTRMWDVHAVIKALANVPFTDVWLTGDFRVALEFLIETKGFSLPLPTQRTVMGQDMPISELAQLLHQMAENISYEIPNFDLDAAIHNIRAGRT